MIDQIKHFSRMVKTVPENILSWMTSVEIIKENYGLKDPTGNPILTDSEKNFLQTTYADALNFNVEELKGSSLFTESKDSSVISILKEYQSRLVAMQKALKPVKEIVKREVDDRTNFVFKHPASKRLIKNKKPLADLLNNLKEVTEFGNHFNSTLIYTEGQEKLTLTEPTTDEECQANKASIDAFAQQYGFSAAKSTEVKKQLDNLLRLPT
jgi:hypothetical protein